MSHWISKVRTRTLRDAPGNKPANVMGYDVIGEMLRPPLHDEFWNERSAAMRLDQIKVPVYSMGIWSSGGVHLAGNILGYELAQGPKKLTLYGYPGSAQRLFAGKELHEELKRWYDYWLKGIDTGIMDERPVRYQVRPTGEWRTAPSWPPPGVEPVRLYLAPGQAGAVQSLNDGSMAWQEPPAEGGSTSYDYPHEEWMGWPGGGTAVMRPDGTLDPLAKIATFTTPPLEQDLELLGAITLKLWASSDQTDTDFLVKVADQAPAGERGSPPAGVTKGWLKASHRELDQQRSRPDRPWHPHTNAEPLTPGEVYELDLEIWPASWVFKKGHRIRLEIAAGDSPPIDGGHDWGIKFGSDTVYHDRAHPSHLLLPVVKR
ncbi:MAG: CocE/NonD family hydrolase [Chloroflexota bacterium]